MRRKAYCWCVLWLWSVNVSHSFDEEQTGNFSCTNPWKCEPVANARQDRSSSQSVGWAPASLNKEGRGVEGSELRGETWLGSGPAQTLPSMMWNGTGGFCFTHKEIILPSNCLLRTGSRPNHLQLLQPQRVTDVYPSLVIFSFCLFKYMLGITCNSAQMFVGNCQMLFWHFSFSPLWISRLILKFCGGPLK